MFLELAEATNTLPYTRGAHRDIPHGASRATTHDAATDGLIRATNRGSHQKSLTLR